LQGNVDTKELYNDACKKFDIFHIAVDGSSSYWRYKDGIKETFVELLGDRLKTSTINALGGTICECIEESVNGTMPKETPVNKDGISW
jgi:hypothetical protein